MATDLEMQQTVVRMAEYNRLVDRYELSLSVKVKEDYTDLLITRTYVLQNLPCYCQYICMILSAVGCLFWANNVLFCNGIHALDQVHVSSCIVVLMCCLLNVPLTLTVS